MVPFCLSSLATSAVGWRASAVPQVVSRVVDPAASISPQSGGLSALESHPRLARSLSPRRARMPSARSTLTCVCLYHLLHAAAGNGFTLRCRRPECARFECLAESSLALFAHRLSTLLASLGAPSSTRPSPGSSALYSGPLSATWSPFLAPDPTAKRLAPNWALVHSSRAHCH